MWKKFIKNNFLIYAILYCIIFVASRYLLNKINIEFMDWFCYLSYNFIFISIVIGIIQLILKIKIKIAKIISIISVIIVFFIVSMLFNIAQAFMYRENYVIKKDNIKMETEYTYWDKVSDIYYYKYINPFMRSYKKINHEYLHHHPNNPFETEAEYSQYVKKSLTHSVHRIYINCVKKIYDVQIKIWDFIFS